MNGEHRRPSLLDRNRWYKQSVIYGIDVDKFADGNGDGIGDFQGLAERIDYIASLGVDCVWLTPFHQSPDRDNGYDIIDHYSVDRRLGSFGDFIEFMELAEQRGIRVISDLVFNHTSNDHEWFQRARQDPGSPYRDYYYWSDDRPDEIHKPMFPGQQDSRWSFDRKAGAYYHHTFYKHQPDLNINNPAVRREFERIMAFWLKLGITGFRIDAAPHLIELPRAEEKHVGDAYWYLREMREFIQWWRAQVMLLAEANVDPEVIPQYFGEGGRMDALLNFIVSQYTALAFARGEAEPIRRGLELTPPIPDSGQWIHFLRNVDELDLGRLTQSERQEVFDAFAPDPAMQVYGRGIRRRLASMLGGDRQRIECAYSLLFTLPGTPLLVYGDEIGMGEKLALPERESVRTVMQWSHQPGFGFTRGPDDIRKYAVTKGPFRCELVNVAQQEGDHSSLLNWMRALIRTRRAHPELGLGRHTVLDVAEPAVFVGCSEWAGKRMFAFHNFADAPCKVRRPESLEGVGLTEVFSNRAYGNVPADRQTIELDDHGYRWLAQDPVWK